LLEKSYLLGVPNTSYITLTLDGPRLRREVRSKSFADSTSRYGILVDLRSDSVTYYIQDATINAHCRLARADYVARVAANEPILPSRDQRPYSTIFAPLPADALHKEVTTGITLSSLADCRAILFLLPDQSRCDVMYSGQVQVPARMLACIEYHNPAALPSLALTVHYTPPPVPRAGTLLQRLKHRLDQVSNLDTEFDSIDPTRPSDRAFALPAGSQYAGSADALEATLQKPSPSHSPSHSHHHYHH
jgi:hypothetical protein